MSAGSLPYHLRPNKAVERLLFVDLLARLDGVLNLEDRYEYVGFGGPQMEDFRVLHERFRGLRMICIEQDPAVLARQRFNQPHTRIVFAPCRSDQFIAQYESRRRRLLAWLDYAAADKRITQIREFQELLLKAPDLSIIKITLNANPESIGGAAADDPERHTKRRNRLVQQFNRFLDDALPDTAVHRENFASTLQQIVNAAASEALKTRPDLSFRLLSSFVYADGLHPMVTATGILAETSEIERVLNDARISTWHFGFEGTRPREINVPDLTPKERIHINQMLPRCQEKPERITRKLRFQLDPDPDVDREKLSQYVDFYRHYPHFTRLAF